MSSTPRRDVVTAIPTPSREPRRLAARLEPFDSYWQAPKDVEKGYKSFAAYYRANYLPRLPKDLERQHSRRELRARLSRAHAA